MLPAIVLQVSVRADGVQSAFRKLRQVHHIVSTLSYLCTCSCSNNMRALKDCILKNGLDMCTPQYLLFRGKLILVMVFLIRTG